MTLPPWTPFAVTGVVLLLGLVLAVTLPSLGTQEHRVAFLGTGGNLIVNDIPRLVEALGDDSLSQSSCFHWKGSLASLLYTGNGMYEYWKTDRARIDDQYYNYLRDYGACTPKQLLLGSDDKLYNSNYNGAYYDDGLNPCFYEDRFYKYNQRTYANETGWTAVVFADQTKRMAFQDTRDDVLDSLESDYGGMLFGDSDQSLSTDATIVVLAPHAFWSDNTNMTGLEDIPTFTSLVYEGAVQYTSKLQDMMDEAISNSEGKTQNKRQKIRIAPVGPAFLWVYEDDSEMYEKLFNSDGIRASVYGSYLTACVVYCTITGHMPLSGSRGTVRSLFERSRAVSGAANGYPDGGEAEYLFDVARKVAKQGRLPSSLDTDPSRI